MKRNSFLLLSFLLTVFLVFTDCSKKSNPAGPGDNGGLTGDITTGGKETVASQTVGTGGGTISVSKEGDPLDGLEITIPQGAFSDTKNITVSEAPIVSHEFGENFQPISPVITVQNVSGYADDVITVKIPVVVPEGHVAIGALYDETTGDFECISLIDQTENSVTLATRTFVPSASAAAKKGIFKSLKAEDALSAGNLLVLSLEESKLKGQAIINTGFTPGVDDWEFVNYGSYIAPGGHCAGQSISAMWYYYEKKLRGSLPLYNQFDKVHSSREVLWQDNPRGYRFASTVQEDINWDTLSYKLFEALESPTTQSLGWRSFALSMFLTGEPQLVGLTSNEGGHAIIAYKIDYNNGILYVADPNYPGQECTIKFNGQKFDPYGTKQNANEPSNHLYTGIGYYAKSSLIDWDKIGSRWSEFENLTIGNNRFPQYSLWVTDDEGGHELEPSEVVNADSIVVQVQWGNGSTDDKIAMTVFDNQGNQIVPASNFFATTNEETIKLKPGENILGFQIWGNPDSTFCWLDFQWVPVNCMSLKIDPVSLTGKKGEDATFTAVIEGNPPDNAKYLWNFGDNTSEVSVLNNPEVTHTYTSDGEYTVTLSLYDAELTPEKLLGTATASVKIGGNTGEVRNRKLFYSNWTITEYGLTIDAGYQDGICLVTDEITVHVKPEFFPSVYGSVTGNIPVDYEISVDGSPIKNGVMIMEPHSNIWAEGYEEVNIGSLPVGNHTIRLVLDPNLKITDTTATNPDEYRIIDYEMRVVKSYLE